LRQPPPPYRRRAVALVVIIAGVLAAAAWAVLQQLNVGSVWMGVGAAAAAALPGVLAEVRARSDRHEQHERRLVGLLRLWTREGGPRVSAVADMVALGITPAAARTSRAESASLAGRATPYVRRTVDDALDAALDDSQLVVLVGDSKAGKSRTAFEAMRRRFPDRLLLVPASKQALAQLAALAMAVPAAVVWLDELDTYLGADGLTVQALDQLADAGTVVILGTMRAAQYASYRAEQEMTVLERKVLERATVLKLPRLLDEAEQRRAAEQGDDPRIAAALNHLDRYGLAEYLAAGPALVDRWQNGQSVEVEPVGAAIVAAAVDWRRVGRTSPVPRSVLEHLYPVYLEDRAPARQTAEAFTQGLGWATQRVFATAALLAEEPAGLVAFDYLVDYVQQQESARVPDRTWEIALAHCTEPDETYKVAAAAYHAKQYDVAEQALRLVVTTKTLTARVAAFNLGVLLSEKGQLEEAKTWYRKAIDAGHSGGAFDLADLLRKQGRLEEAELWYRKAIDAGHSRAAVDLARLLSRQGRWQEAVIWYRKAIDVGHVEAAVELDVVLLELGRHEEAAASDTPVRRRILGGGGALGPSVTARTATV
jgi:uncharacterized protein